MTPPGELNQGACGGALNTTTQRRIVPSLPGDYYAFYEAVHKHMTQAAPLLITARDGANVIRIIELALASNKENACMPVNF